MRQEDREWMAYIDGEVRAVCLEKGWGHQVRRKWSLREKPVWRSPIEDYEWKLVPSAQGEPPQAQPGDFNGAFYVLWFDRGNDRFVLQHDTLHVGLMGPHWEVTTYTEIQPQPLVTLSRSRHKGMVPGSLPVGWLRDHLRELITRFAPNYFSNT